MKRVAIFVSRFDHCLYDLLLRHRAGELACEIPLVVSNHPDHKALAEQFGCAYRVFPISPARGSEQEGREIELLEEARIDLVVLARYMQMLSDGLPRALEPARDQHPPLLPAGLQRRPPLPAGGASAASSWSAPPPTTRPAISTKARSSSRT